MQTPCWSHRVHTDELAGTSNYLIGNDPAKWRTNVPCIHDFASTLGPPSLTISQHYGENITERFHKKKERTYEQSNASSELDPWNMPASGRGRAGFGDCACTCSRRHRTVLHFRCAVFIYGRTVYADKPWAGSAGRAGQPIWHYRRGRCLWRGNCVQAGYIGNETVLYSFTGTGGDGSGPTGVVLDAQGNLYGTTNGGGAFGAGTVFKVDTSGNETVLYSFAGSPDGASPVAGVVLDAQGNLYGTTNGGGAYGAGTVFKVDTTGAETVLYSFHGASGTYPLGGVVLDAQGNLYGTTIGGGAYGLGTVFKVDTTGAETVLYSFTHGTDGQQPHAGVVLDAQGNLYGTTYFGGYLECPADAPLGCGTVFKLDTTGQFTVLHAFGGRGDGFFPLGDLALDVQGNLYGTCFEGPADNGGMVFALYTSGTYTVLHIFTRTKSGIAPGGWDLETGVTLGAQGNLYGTTHIGGGDFQGTLFASLTPAAATTTTLTVLLRIRPFMSDR